MLKKKKKKELLKADSLTAHESEQGLLVLKSRSKENAGRISVYFMAKPITK